MLNCQQKPGTGNNVADTDEIFKKLVACDSQGQG